MVYLEVIYDNQCYISLSKPWFYIYNEHKENISDNNARKSKTERTNSQDEETITKETTTSLSMDNTIFQWY